MIKLEAYKRLLEKRRADRTCYQYGCVNSWHEDEILRGYDEKRNLVDPIDNLDGLDARHFILAQDFGNVEEVKKAAIAGKWQNIDRFGPRLDSIKKSSASLAIHSLQT